MSTPLLVCSEPSRFGPPPFSVGYTVGSSSILLGCTAWFLRSPAVACVPVPVPQSRTHIVQLHETFHRAAFQEHSSSPPSWTPALRGCVLVKERDICAGRTTVSLPITNKLLLVDYFYYTTFCVCFYFEEWTKFPHLSILLASYD